MVALTIIVFIPFGLMLWVRLHQSSGFASRELILYPLLFGGGSIVILYALKRYFLGEPLSDFNNGEGKWFGDLVWGLVLTAIYFGLFVLEGSMLSGLLRFVPNTELLGLMLDLRGSPGLLLLWFGPVLWVGIALYEELIRVFLLTTLWKWSDDVLWWVLAIVLSATIMGLVHWSQGPYGIVTIGIKSLVSGFFFFRVRRLMPLVYAHVLYDGLQVALLLLTYPDSTS